MNNISVQLSIAALIILLIAAIALAVTARYPHYIALQECESELPRSQYCELIAVPRED